MHLRSVIRHRLLIQTTIGHQGSYTSLAQEVQANSKAGPQLVGADFGQFQNQTLWREPCRRLKYKSDA